MKRGSKQNAKEYKNRQYDPFEEGRDRPVGDWMAGKISKISSTNKVAQNLAKVSKKDEGPEHLLDSKKRNFFTDNERRKDPEENAPADSLGAFDKKEKEVMALSLAVESGLADVYTKDSSHDDIPFLWYIPRSGGGMLKNILSNCKNLIVASEVGGTVSKKDKDMLSIVELFGHKYVNVDTTTEQGIREAKAKGLVSSGLANLIISPRLQEAAGLFGPSKKGRTFALFRHPVERAVSMFYFLKKHKVAAVASLELEDYSKSQHVENNWMVRILSDSMTGDIGDKQLDDAKKLLKDKVIIGLLEQKEESMRRFEYHFGWKYTENNQKQQACRTRALVGDYRSNESSKSKVKEGSQSWQLLMWQNRLDMKLYTYAKALYLQQGAELFSDIP